MSFLHSLKKKKLWKLLGLSAAIISFSLALLVWYLAGEVVCPKRRVIQDYHREYLEHPERHSITITQTTVLDGEAPVLIVEPKKYETTLSKRASILRNQLQEMDVSLPYFGRIKANLVLLHGRNGRKEDMLPIAERFCAVGFRCILPDMPAHGESPRKFTNYGTTDFERDFPSAVLREVSVQQGYPEDLPATLWGMSMGGSYAIHNTSHDNAPWKCLIIVCSFDSLDKVILENSQNYTGPFASPLSALVNRCCQWRAELNPASVRPVDFAANIHIPTLVLHGTADKMVAYDRGKSLHAALGSENKQWLDVTNADHQNILITPQPIYAPMAKFLLENTF
ncbi:2-succinyl-6-hydroxy-2, 4-cyclohexadiene-1-carboxylate synthase [Rubritalea halochordaticola]|uniref:2-succinyl-6-hydroxy-2, 4-cyclohexadiene-1-carboxylate synthase n=1 Tax=Rubritalea halochordaticola TaxID=714537 RepID=A0ABP9UXC9_9BACT